ncbi:MAG: hypothetical protein DDT34_02320 [Firmicutes bacterium]|nr:hypothetical protein [Bacillota bacterium]
MIAGDKNRLVRVRRREYNKNHTREKEGDTVTQILEKINRFQLTPQQRATLGLKPDWQKSVTPKFVEKVMKAAAEHKRALDELAKY